MRCGDPSGPRAAACGLRVAGVLGGVGSGKSTAARLLAEALDGVCLDADAAVSELLGEESVLKAIETAFGSGLRHPDGSVDRAALGAHVFGDAARRKTLEGILHPAVRRRLWEGLAAAEEEAARGRGSGWAVLDVPLLLENGLARVCDFLVHIEVPDAERARRAMARHGWDKATWRDREAAQRPVAEKRAAADAILDNAGGVDDLRAAVAGLLPRLRALPPRPLRDRWPDPEQPPPSGPPERG